MLRSTGSRRPEFTWSAPPPALFGFVYQGVVFGRCSSRLYAYVGAFRAWPSCTASMGFLSRRDHGLISGPAPVSKPPFLRASVCCWMWYRGLCNYVLRGVSFSIVSSSTWCWHKIRMRSLW